MKKKMTAILAILLMLSFCSCTNDTNADEETQKPSDWRNTIEYEGNFYVNKDTKLLYALDKGTITLWDNAGDGKTLQVLDYNSAESGAIESLEIKDVNGDGSNDISTVFSQTDKGTKYNLWLWNSELNKYKEINGYRNINNPVVSEDHTTVTGTLDQGIFGVLTTVYTFTQQLTLEQTSVTIADAGSIAQNISNELSGGFAVTEGEGVATVQNTPCTVYVEKDGENLASYIVFSTDGYWYIDKGCTGAYKAINECDGAFEAGPYVDEAGEIAGLCAELYGCEAELLTITATNMGVLSALSYDGEGKAIPPEEIADGEEPSDKHAKGFVISKDGQPLCQMLKTENSDFYCFDPDLAGDNYYHMVSATGETKLVDFSASVYYLQ